MVGSGPKSWDVKEVDLLVFLDSCQISLALSNYWTPRKYQVWTKEAASCWMKSGNLKSRDLKSSSPQIQKHQQKRKLKAAILVKFDSLDVLEVFRYLGASPWCSMKLLWYSTHILSLPIYGYWTYLKWNLEERDIHIHLWQCQAF